MGDPNYIYNIKWAESFQHTICLNKVYKNYTNKHQNLYKDSKNILLDFAHDMIFTVGKIWNID